MGHPVESLPQTSAVRAFLERMAVFVLGCFPILLGFVEVGSRQVGLERIAMGFVKVIKKLLGKMAVGLAQVVDSIEIATINRNRFLKMTGCIQIIRSGIVVISRVQLDREVRQGPEPLLFLSIV